VRKAADRLEEEIEEHAFDDNKSVKGVNFEAVLRVEEEEANSKQNLTKREVEDDLGLSMLIDSQNNRYILTKPRDATIPRADHHFLKDIVTIGMLSLPCGWLCTTIGLPTMFGYIICGVLLGPSGLNSIKSVVQVETLGEVGVFFTLFLVGLEFSPERLRKVWKIALQGPCYMTLLMIAFGLLWGHLLQIRPTQSVFISTCLSLSSTPLVSRFLVGSARGEKEAGDIDYSAVLLGMLVVQDVQLGLFIAGMPTLIQAAAGAYSSVVMETLRILALVGQILFSLAAAFLLCLVIKTYLIGPYYRKLHVESKGNKEILILGISAFIFLMLMVWKIALQGPCYMTLLMIAFGLLWGHLLQIRPTQSVFISTCLSLSSTPLVSRFLVGSARGEKEAGDIDYSAVLLGMLVVQDVQLGLFIAGMPTLIQAAAGAYSRSVCHVASSHSLGF